MSLFVCSFFINQLCRCNVYSVPSPFQRRLLENIQLTCRVRQLHDSNDTVLIQQHLNDAKTLIDFLTAFHSQPVEIQAKLFRKNVDMIEKVMTKSEEIGRET